MFSKAISFPAFIFVSRGNEEDSPPLILLFHRGFIKIEQRWKTRQEADETKVP